MLHKILKYDNVLGPWFKGLLFERLIASSTWPLDLQDISFGVHGQK